MLSLDSCCEFAYISIVSCWISTFSWINERAQHTCAHTHIHTSTKPPSLNARVCIYMRCYWSDANLFCEFGTLNCNEIKLNSLETLKEFLITLINLL